MNTKTTVTVTVDISNEAAVEKVIELLEEANRESRRQKHAEALAADTSTRDVHTGHCCARHGCKYRCTEDEQNCSVANGSKVQDYFEMECCVDVYEDMYEVRRTEAEEAEANSGFTWSAHE